MEFRKGKKNKLNIGNKVKIRPEMTEWVCNNLIDSYGKNSRTTHHKVNFDESDLPIVGSWLYHNYTKKMPVAEIIGYGSNSVDKQGKEIKGLNNVCLEVKLKFCKETLYLDEKDVLKVK